MRYLIEALRLERRHTTQPRFTQTLLERNATFLPIVPGHHSSSLIDLVYILLFNVQHSPLIFSLTAPQIPHLCITFDGRRLKCAPCRLESCVSCMTPPSRCRTPRLDPLVLDSVRLVGMEVVRPVHFVNPTCSLLIFPYSYLANGNRMTPPCRSFCTCCRASPQSTTHSLFNSKPFRFPLTTSRGLSPVGPSLLIPSTSPFLPRSVYCDSGT